MDIGIVFDGADANFWLKGSALQITGAPPLSMIGIKLKTALLERVMSWQSH